MKKKFFIIISIFCIFKTNNVYAELLEYDTPIDNPLFNLVETEKRYMWYQEILEDIGYSNDETIDFEETYIDEKDMILEYSNWSEYKGESKDNLEYRILYDYQTILPLKVIEISTNEQSHISEIEVFVNNEKINYDIACTDCAVEEIKYLYDDKINNTQTYNLSQRGKILLVLNEEYPLNNIETKIYKVNNNDAKFNISFTKDQYNYENTITKENLTINDSYDENIDFNTFKIDETWLFNVEYSESKRSLEYIENNWYTKVIPYIEYREVYKKYHYYNIKREYVDGYYKDNPNIELNLKRDEQQFKIFYKYEISSNISNFSDISNDENNFDNLFSNINPNIPDYSYLSSQVPSFSIDDLLENQTNQLDVNNLYNPNVYNTTDLTNVEENIPKIDTSNYKTQEIEDNNISKYLNYKNLKILISIIVSLFLVILFINHRYRKS